MSVATSTVLRVFDPAMCCSTGVCGPSVDPELVRFAGDVDRLRRNGVAVERYNLAQNPEAFVVHEVVREALQQRGETCLPLVLVNEQIVASGFYPPAGALRSLLGIQTDEGAAASADSDEPCCGEGSC